MLADSFARLRTSRFADWCAAIDDVREQLDRGERHTIDRLDQLMILRPYLWWREKLRFREVVEASARAMRVLLDHARTLRAPVDGTMSDTFTGVTTFLAAALDDGAYDVSGWRVPPSPPEIQVQIAADAWTGVLDAAGHAGAAEMTRALATTMRELYSRKHVAYWVLRHVGDQQLETLEGLLPALPPSDQTFILHALDQFLSQPAVVDVYRRFIAATPHAFLRQAAQKYADGFL